MASKLDAMRNKLGSNVGESMGQGKSTEPAVKGPTIPARLLGLVKASDAAWIPVDKIEADASQPREEFESEALERLADSLKQRGQLQPIRVRWDGDKEKYVIIVGERRWRAARMAGLAELVCIISAKDASESDVLIEQLVENCLREDLRPMEKAKAFKTLMDSQGWGVRELSRQLAVNHAGVVQTLALLDLPGDVQTHVEDGSIAPTTAYEISQAEPAVQSDLAQRVVNEGMTRNEVRESVKSGVVSRQPRAGKPASKGKPASVTTPVFEAKARPFTSPDGLSVANFLMAVGSSSDNDINDFLVYIRSQLKVTKRPKLPKSKPKAAGKQRRAAS
jgi:ParB family chromosome partitioning protein